MKSTTNICILLSGLVFVLILVVISLATRRCPKDAHTLPGVNTEVSPEEIEETAVKIPEVDQDGKSPDRDCNNAALWIHNNYTKHNIYKVNKCTSSTALGDLMAYIYQCEGGPNSWCPYAKDKTRNFTCQTPSSPTSAVPLVPTEKL